VLDADFVNFKRIATESGLADMPFHPRNPLPPLEQKPTLPMDPDDGGPVSLDFEGIIRDLLAPGTSDQEREIRTRRVDSVDLLTTIDPFTGDSIVHRAAAAGDLAVLDAIPSCFGWQLTSHTERLLWVLIVHQNKNGDTALHAAARAGNLKGVRGLYRIFHLRSCHPYFDLDDYGEADLPPEYWGWGAEEGLDEYANRPALDFVCMKNRAGRDAAGEAREAGHESLAVFLEHLVTKLDCDGMRTDEEYMRDARVKTLEHYNYLEPEDGK
jgi:hypothetical protein